MIFYFAHFFRKNPDSIAVQFWLIGNELTNSSLHIINKYFFMNMQNSVFINKPLFIKKKKSKHIYNYFDDYFQR